MDEGKRDRLLKAAIKVFARDGFFKARVEEIARLAGVATGTTYLYFENKDDILISIFEEEIDPIIEDCRRQVAEKVSTAEKIEAFVWHHLKMVRDNEDMAQLLEVELRQSSKFMHNYQGTKFKEYLAIVEDIIKEGQEKGEVKKSINPILFKQILFGAVDQIALTWTLSKSRKIPLEESARQISEVVLHGVLA